MSFCSLVRRPMEAGSSSSAFSVTMSARSETGSRLSPSATSLLFLKDTVSRAGSSASPGGTCSKALPAHSQKSIAPANTARAAVMRAGRWSEGGEVRGRGRGVKGALGEGPRKNRTRSRRIPATHSGSVEMLLPPKLRNERQGSRHRTGGNLRSLHPCSETRSNRASDALLTPASIASMSHEFHSSVGGGLPSSPPLSHSPSLAPAPARWWLLSAPPRGGGSRRASAPLPGRVSTNITKAALPRSADVRGSGSEDQRMLRSSKRRRAADHGLHLPLLPGRADGAHAPAGIRTQTM